MHIKNSLFAYLILLLAVTSCKKDTILYDASAKLGFSVDSVLFDTVFTSIGSTTKVFKIYNPYKQKLNISKAYIATGISSPFRINIDGDSGPAIENIEILPQDSLFVFVQVTVNPNGGNAPLLIKDSVIFITNGNAQKVLLTAVGQDVYLHKPTIFPTDGSPAYSLIDCTVPWASDKPHLIFGQAVVGSGEILTVSAGTRVYMNTAAVLKVADGGTMKMYGTYDSIISIQGARLEEDYKDIAGQWGKIWFSSGSINNEINWVVMKNGTIGIQADSLGVSGVPLLSISNTIIKNMSSAAIYARHAHIRSYNCVFANSGQYTAALIGGGNYTFQHCTFANYWNSSNRMSSSLKISNYYVFNGATYNNSLDSAYFGNCIIDGSLNDEVSLEQMTGIFNYTFQNCIVKTTMNMTNDGLHYIAVQANDVSAFKDVENDDYQLEASSAAIDKGYTSTIVSDLKNNTRPNPGTSIPDLGAYEYY
jgi:hypothetical protein